MTGTRHAMTHARMRVARHKTLQFNEEDVRAVAATLYIQASKDPLFNERVVTQRVNGGATWPQQ